MAEVRLGMKTGACFYRWTPETAAAERRRYDEVLRAGLRVLAAELPPIDDLDEPDKQDERDEQGEPKEQNDGGKAASGVETVDVVRRRGRGEAWGRIIPRKT